MSPRTVGRRAKLLVAPFLLMLVVGCHEEPKTPARPHVGHLQHVLAGVNCTRCHVGVGQTEGLHLPTNPVCVACHEDVHERDPEKQDCLDCHMEEEAEVALGTLKKSLAFDHAVHLERVGGDCVRCHRDAARRTSARIGAIPTMNDCAQCHQDWLDDLRCDTCHVDLINYPLAPVTHQAHQGDYLRRHVAETLEIGVARCAQCHSESFCADCHSNRAPFAAAQAWPDRPDRGFVHRPNYIERHAWEARIEGPLCLTCHTETTCASCHTAAGRGPGGLSPHPPGWASAGAGNNTHAVEARRDVLACASCHAGAGGDLCVTCHAPGRPGGSPHSGRRPAGNPRHDQPCSRCHGAGL
ncbi:MAG: hypothetical protein H6704_10755 [Myxococcales bacterium]|nr:hypothetical protein [Myxococcales bacterium]